jgi:predicted  nucleic acid-binding Zn-ribbon protein
LSEIDKKQGTKIAEKTKHIGHGMLRLSTGKMSSRKGNIITGESLIDDVRDIAGVKDEEIPVFLDFESIRIVKPGKYLLDIGKLFEAGKPKVYQLEDGKYVVDLSSQGKTII